MRVLPLALLVTAVAACRTQPAQAPAQDEPRGSAQAQATGTSPLVFAESEPHANPSASKAPRKGQARLPDETLRQLYACWFERPYPYMFDPPQAGQEPLPIAELSAGRYMAGISGIMDYGSLSRCAEGLTGSKKSSYSALEPIESLAGMEIREDVHRHKYLPGRFNRYYPQIIRWGAGALVPDPSLIIVDGWTAQRLYSVGFSRFFRLMAHSYVELVSAADLASDTARYLEATAEGIDGLDWLHGHYGGRLSQYGGFHDGTQMTPAMAFGFWLRRSHDGVDQELAQSLGDLLELYDRAWLDDLRLRYPNTL